MTKAVWIKKHIHTYTKKQIKIKKTVVLIVDCSVYHQKAQNDNDKKEKQEQEKEDPPPKKPLIF